MKKLPERYLFLKNFQNINFLIYQTLIFTIFLFLTAKQSKITLIFVCDTKFWLKTATGWTQK